MVTEARIEVGRRSEILIPVLIGMVLVSLPLYLYLSPFVLWYVFILTVWSALVIRGRVPAPKAWLRFVLAILVVGVLYYSYDAVIGLLPGTSMVILLSYLKLLEIKNKRDVTVIIFLGYFLASSAFFHNQSVWMAFYVFILAIYYTSLLILISDRKNSVDWRVRLISSARMVLQSLPLMLIMFVLFPRIPGPLWELPNDAQSATSGLSEEMTPGNISKLVKSYEVAFRVAFENQVPKNKDLYWRGLVLSNYDGKTWRREDAPQWTEPDVFISNSEDSANYRVTLEPHQQNWLYALEQVVATNQAYRVTRELQLLMENRVSSVTSYTASASLRAQNRALFPPERRKNLLLPGTLNPETVEFGRRINRAAAGDEHEIVAAVLRHFSTEEFYYTLTPPLLGENSMDDFIFNSRRGFCEHYASAFVYLMRAAGVPARVVVGYQGGEINPLDGYMIVRQSDAHAWAEVWVDNQRWRRVDPTMAVAPQRIERGIQGAGLEARLLPRLILMDSDILNRARFVWDSFQNGWNQWVVGFDEKRQLELFKKLGVDKIEKSTLLLWLVAGMSVAGLLVAWWVIRFNRFSHRGRVRTQYARFKNKLARAGIKLSEQDTAQELLVKVRRSLPDLADSAAIIVKLYQALIYGYERTSENEKRFIRAVRRFQV